MGEKKKMIGANDRERLEVIKGNLDASITLNSFDRYFTKRPRSKVLREGSKGGSFWNIYYLYQRGKYRF